MELPKDVLVSSEDVIPVASGHGNNVSTVFVRPVAFGRDQSKSSSSGFVPKVVMAILILVIALVGAVYYIKRKRRQNHEHVFRSSKSEKAMMALNCDDASLTLESTTTTSSCSDTSQESLAFPLPTEGHTLIQTVARKLSRKPVDYPIGYSRKPSRSSGAVNCIPYAREPWGPETAEGA